MINAMKLFPYLEEWYLSFPARIKTLGSLLDVPDLTFSAILFTLNAILWPYLGLVHDARLYALQALNHSQNGRFAQDLFFKYGSQDRFSIFSAFMGPVVSRLGLEMSFWIAYVLFSSLFIYAVVRLIRTLIPDRWLANIGIIALVAFSLPYGGWDIFHARESFFTARSAAEGLSLLGIEAVLQNRYPKSILFALASLILHPLMGIGSLLVVVAGFCLDQVKSKKATVTALSLGVAAFLLLTAFGWNSMPFLRPGMDVRWISAIKDINWYCFPSEWRFTDWYRLTGCVAIVLFASRWLERRARKIVRIIVCVGLAGTSSTILGEYLGVPLLLQGQGYRAAWVVEALAIPLGVFMINRFVNGAFKKGKWIALGIFFFIGDPFSLFSDLIPMTPDNLPIYALFLSVVALFLLHKGDSFNRESVQFAICAGLVAWSVALSFTVIAIKIRLGIHSASDPIAVAVESAMMCSRTFLFLISLLYLSGFIAIWRRVAMRGVLALAALTWIALSSILFVTRESASYRAHFEPGYSDVDFIAKTIAEKGPKGQGTMKAAQIYWPNHPAQVWFQLRSNNYFHFTQLSGAVFSKETCMEGQRRAALVRPFEIEWMKEERFESKYQKMMLRSMKAEEKEPLPTEKDLLRLARDGTVDWIVLKAGFGDLYCATNNSVFIYDASAIRRRI